MDSTHHDHSAPSLFVMTSQESFPILNPVVYLNYLNQTVGSDYEATRDVSLATLGVRFAAVISAFCPLMRTGEGLSLGYSLEYPGRLQIDPDREDIGCVVCLLPG